MPTQLTITGSTISELEVELNALKSQLAQQIPTAQQNGVANPQLRAWLQSLKTQSGITTGKTWLMVFEIATNMQGQFNLQDISLRLNVPKANVRAWQRNISRWSKRTGVKIFAHVAGTHHPTQFEMPADVRREILHLGA